MLKIKENGTSDISYTVQTIQDGCVMTEITIKCKALQVPKDGKVYFVIFNRDLEIIQDAFAYLNIYLSTKTEQTRQKSMVALKYLYSYSSIFNIDIKEMKKADASAFIAFLMGQSVIGVDVQTEFNSFRSAASVNDYLSAIRSYLNYLGCKKHPLLEKTGKRNLSITYRQPQFSMKVKQFNRLKVPPYISKEEFIKLIEKCRENNDLRSESLIRLMYQSGLRLGETLGLTLEDIVEKDGKFKVILRNRYTDKRYQKAKFLLTITDRNQYKSSDYQKEWFAWNEMAITPAMYETLMEYIEQAHNDASVTARWKQYTIADIVTPDFSDENNFYVFINSWGRPLSDRTAEADIKRLFIECGIPVNESGGKEDGLAHRFRHGFAMYQVTVNGIDKLPLSKMMRHRNIESVEAYYTPELSDVIRIKNEISETIYDLLPRFDIDENNKGR